MFFYRYKAQLFASGQDAFLTFYHSDVVAGGEGRVPNQAVRGVTHGAR